MLVWFPFSISCEFFQYSKQLPLSPHVGYYPVDLGLLSLAFQKYTMYQKTGVLCSNVLISAPLYVYYTGCVGSKRGVGGVVRFRLGHSRLHHQDDRQVRSVLFISVKRSINQRSKPVQRLYELSAANNSFIKNWFQGF